LFAEQFFLPAIALIHGQRLQLIHDSRAHLHQPMPVPQQFLTFMFYVLVSEMVTHHFFSSGPRLAKDYAIVDTVWQRVYPSGTGPTEHDRPAAKMNFCRGCDLQIGLL
jgi:hypothetical protein